MRSQSRLAIDGGMPARPVRKPVRVISPGAFFVDAEETSAVIEVLRRGVLYRHWGTEVQGFEDDLATYLGGGHALALNSGTSALAAALGALGVKSGDDVIVPAYSFIGIASAVVLLGGRPVFCDVDASLTVPAEAVRSVLSPRTRGLVAVHMRGAPCNLVALRGLCEKYGIFLMEDSSQAFGATLESQPVGSIGDMGCFSFQFFKVITCGEGGALFTHDRALFERARQFHDVATTWSYRNVNPATDLLSHLNLRMGEIEGALARVQLRKTQAILSALRARKCQLLDLLGGPPSGTALRPVREGVEEASIALILLLDETMPGVRMSEALKAEGVEAALLLTPGCPLPDRHFCQGWGNILGQERLSGEHSCLVTKSLLERSLELQIDPRWSSEDLAQIAEGLYKVFHYFSR